MSLLLVLALAACRPESADAPAADAKGAAPAKEEPAKPTRRRSRSEPEPEPVKAPVKPVSAAPVSPPLVGWHLRWLGATGGETVELAFDADPGTGWRIAGDPIEDVLHLRLEAPIVLDTLTIRLCPESPGASLVVGINGADAGRVDVAPGTPGVLRIGPGGAGLEVASASLRVASGRPGLCVAEVEAGHREVAWQLRPPRRVEGTIRASSVRLPPLAYHPWYLLDQRPDFAWVEGKTGNGVGETVALTLADPLALAAVELWSGDQRSLEAWQAQARPRRFGLSVDRGATLQLAVEDRRGSQKLLPPAWLVGRQFVLSVLDAVDGTGKTAEDLAISEIRLWDPLGPVQVVTPDPADRRASLTAEIDRSSFAGLLDRRWEPVCAPGTRTFKLRANLGVAWVRTVGGAPERFEGDWAILGQKAPWTELTLAGRRRPLVTTWQGPDLEVDLPGERSTVRIARVADLDAAAWTALVPRGRGARDAEWGCVDGLDPGDAAADRAVLVAHEAIVLRHGEAAELWWLAPPPG